MRLFDKLKSISRRFKQEVNVYRLVLKDSRTPRRAKLLLALALGYLMLPFDLVPDFIPVLGSLDDVIIVPTLVIVALRMVPREVVEDCRARAGDA
ncbi:MAG: hypothetical protein HW388_1053 [Dehalococcoidia bacterium]|nr:hypothetical protein [Dehalococcoidia bacterium]